MQILRAKAYLLNILGSKVADTSPAFLRRYAKLSKKRISYYVSLGDLRNTKYAIKPKK